MPVAQSTATVLGFVSTVSLSANMFSHVKVPDEMVDV